MYLFVRPLTSSPRSIATFHPSFLGVTMATLLFATTWIFFPPASRAAIPEQIDDTSSMTLVFSDDFSTDPNSNGLWTIHRYDNDPKNEAYWSATSQSWHLTRANTYKAVAVFANYDLTATGWKAEFDYRVGKLGGFGGGGDGFVFMFYKNKGAYGRPGYGQFMGFELVTPYIVPVQGYGLKFDNYFNQECDPTENSYIGLIEDTTCQQIKVFREDDRTGDGLWHSVDFTYSDGQIKVKIDTDPAWNGDLRTTDYSFSGIGFGAGTGSAVADHEIDNFRLWVR